MRVSNIFLDFAATAYVYLDMAARTFYLAEENIGLYERIMRACRKSGKSFSRAADEVIAFYKTHNHSVRNIRCDAGSSENDSTAVAHLRDDHGVTIQPAAPGHQHQNPVEREVQTLIKGVSCMLLDQHSLGAT